MLGSIRQLIARRVLVAIMLATLSAAGACSTTDALTTVQYTAPVPEKFAAIVVDGATGETLYSANANELRYPASLTKMMTLYMLFGALDSGVVTLHTQIPVSAEAARQPPSKLGVKAGDSLSVDTAIRALAVKSANDVATAVAEFLSGGTEADFAALMTTQARALGMTGTRFTNASGLPDSEQVSTASDMAKLALALKRRFPHHYRYFSLREFEHRGRTIRGHNKALDMIAGADGLKTGYTRASGFNLATSARHNGRYVVGVVMGEDTARNRDERMTQLISFYARR